MNTAMNGTAVIPVAAAHRQRIDGAHGPGAAHWRRCVVVYSSTSVLCRRALCCAVGHRTLHRTRPRTTPLQGDTAVASNTSKTARASVRAGQAGAAGGALSVLGEFKYLIPLNSGKHAYVRNLTNGQTLRLATNSEAFAAEIQTLAKAGHAAKIRAEIQALAAANPTHGWDATEQRLVDAGIFEA